MAALASIFVLSISIAAQGIGTTEYYMGYGRGYFEARKYDMAIMYFEDAVRKDPDNAEANYLLGTSYLKLGKPEKARPFLEKAGRLDAKYGQKVEPMAGQSGPEEKQQQKLVSSQGLKNDGSIVEYEVGDRVEVFYAGQWNAGRIVSVQGRGESVRAEVEYIFQGEKRTAKFFYNAVQHAGGGAKIGDLVTKNVRSGMTLGEYGCSSKIWSGGRWAFTPRGSFKLQVNGTYTQTNGGGKIRYDAGQNAIIFTGGFFGNSEAKGKVISSSQIDITFSDSYWWTCALQK